MSARMMSGFSTGIRAMASSPSPTATTCTSSPENVSSMTRWMVTLSSARRSFFGTSLRFDPRPGVAGDEIDDVLHRRAGQEDAFDPDLVQLRDVHVGNDAADHHEHVVQPLLAEQFHHARADVHVRAGQDREADGVRILLERGRDDLFRRLPEARVNDLHAGIAQGPGDHLGAPVVPIKARFRNDYADFLHRSLKLSAFLRILPRRPGAHRTFRPRLHRPARRRSAAASCWPSRAPLPSARPGWSERARYLASFAAL